MSTEYFAGEKLSNEFYCNFSKCGRKSSVNRREFCYYFDVAMDLKWFDIIELVGSTKKLRNTIESLI